MSADNTDADVKKVAAAAISSAKEDAKADTKDAKDAKDTNDAKNAKDTNDTNDAADAKDTNDAADAKNAKDTNDTNDAADAKDAKDTNDTVDAKADTNDAADANDAKDTNDTNDAADANDANDANDETNADDETNANDADDTTDKNDAKDGDVEKKPNKRSVGQQERRERERQAKDINNRNIVKEKLLGNIKKSQFVGNAINPKMQGLYGFFETFLKNTNKELQEGEEEKKKKEKEDILKLFGDTNLLASINKLDAISIKKNFKTFIFNSMNDISEFFFDKNDQTETDEYDKTYFKDFFIGIKDENLDLNKKYTLFYNKKTENLELISDGEKGFKISLEPGEENIYKINVGDFLSDYEADKEAGPDKDTKEADEEVFDEQDIGDTISDIKEKVEKNEKLDKNNIDISRKTREIRNIKDESNLELDKIEENLTLINEKFDDDIKSINGDLNEKDKEIQTKMNLIKQYEDGPKKKELKTNLLQLEKEREKLIKDKKEKIEEKNKKIAPIEEEKNRIIKERREKIEEQGNEKKELLLENQSLRKQLKNLEKKNDPDLPDDLEDISPKIEGIKKEEKEDKKNEEIQKKITEEGNTKLDEFKKKQNLEIDNDVMKIRNDIENNFKTKLQNYENKDVKKCFFKENNNVIKFINYNNEIENYTQKPIEKDDLLEIRNWDNRRNFKDTGNVIEMKNEKIYYFKYYSKQKINNGKSGQWLYDEDNKIINTIEHLENVSDNYKLRKKESIIEKEVEEKKKNKREELEKERTKIEVDTAISRIASRGISHTGRVRAELVEDTKSDGDDRYRLIAIDRVKWGDQVEVEFPDGNKKIIKLEKNMEYIEGGAKEEFIESGETIITLSLKEINQNASEAINEAKEKVIVKNMFNDWEPGYKKGFIVKEKGKYYLESDEPLIEKNYFQAIRKDTNIEHFETTGWFQIGKFKEGKKGKIILYQEDKKKQKAYYNKIDELIVISNLHEDRKKMENEKKQKQEDNISKIKKRISNDEEKEKIFNEIVKKIPIYDIKNNNYVKLDEQYKIQSGGVSIIIIAGIILKVAAIVVQIRTIYFKWQSQKKRMKIKKFENKDKLSEEDVTTILKNYLSILKKDSFKKYLNGKEVPKEEYDYIDNIDGEYIFVVLFSFKNYNKEIEKKNYKVIKELIDHSDELKNAIFTEIDKIIKEKNEKKEEEEKKKKRRADVINDDMKGLEKQVNDLVQQLEDDYDIYRLIEDDLEGVIESDGKKFNLSLKKCCPKDKIVKFEIDDESNLYCKSNELIKTRMKFSKLQKNPVTRKELKEKTKKILKERLKNLTKVKKREDENKEKKIIGSALHVPKPKIKKKSYQFQTNNKKYILINPEDYPFKKVGDKIDLYYFPMSKISDLQKENAEAAAKVRGEWEQNKKETNTHNENKWFSFQARKLPKVGIEEIDAWDEPIYYRGWEIEKFSFKEAAKNGDYSFDNPNKEGGGNPINWIRKKVTGKDTDKNLYNITIYVKKELLDKYINEKRDSSIDEIIDIIKKEQEKMNNSLLKEIKIPEQIIDNDDYFNILSNELIFYNGRILDECFENYPEDKNLISALNFEKKKYYKIRHENKKLRIKTGYKCKVYDCAPKGMFKSEPYYDKNNKKLEIIKLNVETIKNNFKGVIFVGEKKTLKDKYDDLIMSCELIQDQLKELKPDDGHIKYVQYPNRDIEFYCNSIKKDDSINPYKKTKLDNICEDLEDSKIQEIINENFLGNQEEAVKTNVINLEIPLLPIFDVTTNEFKANWEYKKVDSISSKPECLVYSPGKGRTRGPTYEIIDKNGDKVKTTYEEQIGLKPGDVLTHIGYKCIAKKGGMFNKINISTWIEKNIENEWVENEYIKAITVYRPGENKRTSSYDLKKMIDSYNPVFFISHDVEKLLKKKEDIGKTAILQTDLNIYDNKMIGRTGKVYTYSERGYMLRHITGDIMLTKNIKEEPSTWVGKEIESGKKIVKEKLNDLGERVRPWATKKEKRKVLEQRIKYLEENGEWIQKNWFETITVEKSPNNLTGIKLGAGTALIAAGTTALIALTGPLAFLTVPLAGYGAFKIKKKKKKKKADKTTFKSINDEKEEEGDDDRMKSQKRFVNDIKKRITEMKNIFKNLPLHDDDLAVLKNIEVSLDINTQKKFEIIEEAICKLYIDCGNNGFPDKKSTEWLDRFVMAISYNGNVKSVIYSIPLHNKHLLQRDGIFKKYFLNHNNFDETLKQIFNNITKAMSFSSRKVWAWNEKSLTGEFWILLKENIKKLLNIVGREEKITIIDGKFAFKKKPEQTKKEEESFYKLFKKINQQMKDRIEKNTKLTVGDFVTWKYSDNDIPVGEVGEVVGFEPNKIRDLTGNYPGGKALVRFPRGPWYLAGNTLKKTTIKLKYFNDILTGILMPLDMLEKVIPYCYEDIDLKRINNKYKKSIATLNREKIKGHLIGKQVYNLDNKEIEKIKNFKSKFYRGATGAMAGAMEYNAFDLYFTFKTILDRYDGNEVPPRRPPRASHNICPDETSDYDFNFILKFLKMHISAWEAYYKDYNVKLLNKKGIQKNREEEKKKIKKKSKK